jgi:glutamyl-tRNA reductase
MRIGVLGAGVMADAPGTRWAAAGHELMVAGRTAAKAEALARKWGGRAGSFKEVAAFADIALIAVLYQSKDPHEPISARSCSSWEYRPSLFAGVRRRPSRLSLS